MANILNGPTSRTFINPILVCSRQKPKDISNNKAIIKYNVRLLRQKYFQNSCLLPLKLTYSPVPALLVKLVELPSALTEPTGSLC